jgi:hypothetical protein
VVFTTVPQTELTSEEVLELYRIRWQIELRLKHLTDILALILRGSWVSVNGFRPVLAARRGFFNFPRLPVSQASPSHRLRAAF